MKDYKELISALREEAEAVKAVERDIPTIKLFLPCTSNHIAEAADVIEQDNEIIASLQRELVETAKERDQWMTLGHLANKRAEDYRGMRRQRDEAIKERDNARRTLDQTLVRLNDETVRADRLEVENRAKEQYIAETIGKVIKERDAAIAFVPRVCKTCKRDGLQYLAGGKLDSLCDTCRRNRRCNWEWRGVQEVAK